MFTCGLIDQHPIFRLGLQIYLEQNFHEIDFYPAKGLDDFSKLPIYKTIDMIIIGLDNESRLDWLKLIKLCKLKHPRATLIVLAEIIEIETVLRVLKLGVTGVVLKENEPGEILDCIKKIQQGHIYMSPEFEKTVLNRMMTNEGTDRLSNRNRSGLHSLTVRQYLMATYLIKGMKTSEIAKALMVSPSTVSTIKATILKKNKRSKHR